MIKQFKIRASACSHIMGLDSITDKQLIELNTLHNKEKRTANQELKLIDLIRKRDNPVITEGVKTHCKNWLKGQLYNRQKDIHNKYMDKGNIVEDESIDFVAEQLDYGMLMKNEDHFSNDFMQGTPDVVLPDLIIDVKNSWSWETFPLFETDINPVYYWQSQVYMALTGRKHFKLIYTLMNTPTHLIRKEAYYYAINNGWEELTQDIYDEFLKRMTYLDVPDSLKIKVFNIDRNDEDITRIEQQVIRCREYIESLI